MRWVLSGLSSVRETTMTVRQACMNQVEPDVSLHITTSTSGIPHFQHQSLVCLYHANITRKLTVFWVGNIREIELVVQAAIKVTHQVLCHFEFHGYIMNGHYLAMLLSSFIHNLASALPLFLNVQQLWAFLCSTHGVNHSTPQRLS